MDAPPGQEAAAPSGNLDVQMTSVQIEPPAAPAAVAPAQLVATNGVNGEAKPTQASNLLDLEEYFRELDREREREANTGALDVLMQPMKAGFAMVDQTLSAVPGVNAVKNVAGKGLDFGMQGLQKGVDLGTNILAPGVESLMTGAWSSQETEGDRIIQARA